MAAGQWLRGWQARRGERSSAAASLAQVRPTSWRQRLGWVVGAFGAAVAVCGFLDLKGFAYLEQYSYNLRLGVLAARHGSLEERARKQIVLVTLSDDSFRELPGPPVPRSYHAKVLRDLTRAGAKVVAFDLVFDLPRPQDREFAAAAKALGRVVWACVIENEHSRRQRLVLPTVRLRQASHWWGHVHVPQDEERPATDRIEAVVMHHGRPVPALSVEAVRLALGLQNRPIRRRGQEWRVGGFSIPVDAEGCFHITYVGKPGETFHPVLYEQLYAGAVDDEFYRKTRYFRDKIVLIGDTTTVGNDHRYTPVGDMFGVEIHAHAIATLLQRGFVREAPLWVNLLMLCLLAGLVCPLSAVGRLQWAIVAAAGLVLGYFAINVWLFADHCLWLRLVAPSSGAVLATLGVLTERGLTEEREKRRMLGLLQRYVSPQIAKYVLGNPEKCFLGGERVTATVLFSDIRGFTAMSEKLSPEAVVERLNEYLQAMTNMVFKHDGAVDKYVGDAIMALFGIPVPHSDHARRAVATAIDMQTALLELQAQWQAQGLPPFDIGIGINTGEMVVGNIGAKERLDFTVIGDAVNLASRVESLNKELHSRILITEATYQLIRDEVRARGPLRASVKGKEEEAVVYEVFGWGEAAQPSPTVMGERR